MSKLGAGGPGLGFGGQRAGQGENGRPHTSTSLVCPTAPRCPRHGHTAHCAPGSQVLLPCLPRLSSCPCTLLWPFPSRLCHTPVQVSSCAATAW